LPETHESIVFDDDGVCSVCRQVEFKQQRIDWAAREQQLVALIEEYRGKYSYDCLVPFSGGKDSTFTLLKLVRDYKVKPLVVSFDHGFFRPNTLQNTERTIKELGVDYMRFRPNWQLVQKLMLESLKRRGDFCWHCHVGVFAYPMQIAVRFKVPLVFWGEPSAEYSSYYSYENPEEVDERRFNRFVNLGITAEDMIGMLDDDVDPRDLEPFQYPKLKDLRAINYRSVCLGSFVPWDVKQQAARIEAELGWKEDVVEGVPPGYGYEKIECSMQGVRDYLKFKKRGYGRTTHLASIDIRNGRLDRAEALRMSETYDGKRPASLDVFLDYVGIDEKQLDTIISTHAVSPWVSPDSDQFTRGKALPDQEKWDRTKSADE
jgi:N-acetyl sugar amidotransferase